MGYWGVSRMNLGDLLGTLLWICGSTLFIKVLLTDQCHYLSPEFGGQGPELIQESPICIGLS